MRSRWIAHGYLGFVEFGAFGFWGLEFRVEAYGIGLSVQAFDLNQVQPLTLGPKS